MNTLIDNNCRLLKMQKWIGLARVRPRPGNDALGGALGAFVASIALAESAGDYASKMTVLLNELAFEVLEIEDVELLDDRMRAHSLSPDILKLAKQVDEETPLVLADFHSFRS